MNQKVVMEKRKESIKRVENIKRVINIVRRVLLIEENESLEII